MVIQAPVSMSVRSVHSLPGRWPSFLKGAGACFRREARLVMPPHAAMVASVDAGIPLRSEHLDRS